MSLKRRRRAPCALFVLVASAAVLYAQATDDARLRRDEAREKWQKVPEILDALAIGPGSRVADVGAGDGFFTVRLARRVAPGGRVYAVDISRQQLQRLQARVDAERLSGVETIESTEDDPKLPDALDAILVVNSYHEFERYEAMVAHFRKALRPDGRLILVEPMAASARGKSRAEQVKQHRLAAEHAEADLRAAGFRVELLHDPFTSQPDGVTEEWLVMARPMAAASTSPTPTDPSPAQELSETELADPALRVTFEEFDVLRAAGHAAIVDVRGADEYETGHVPGAVSIPLGSVSGQADHLKQLGRPIVTYCS